jgi:hypothetical protein
MANIPWACKPPKKFQAAVTPFEIAWLVFCKNLPEATMVVRALVTFSDFAQVW